MDTQKHQKNVGWVECGGSRTEPTIALESNIDGRDKRDGKAVDILSGSSSYLLRFIHRIFHRFRRIPC